MDKKEFIKDVHYYLQDGKVVFTEKYHLERGKCCGNKCKHCHYDPQYEKGNTNVKK